MSDFNETHCFIKLNLSEIISSSLVGEKQPYLGEKAFSGGLLLKFKQQSLSSGSYTAAFMVFLHTAWHCVLHLAIREDIRSMGRWLYTPALELGGAMPSLMENMQSTARKSEEKSIHLGDLGSIESCDIGQAQKYYRRQYSNRWPCD